MTRRLPQPWRRWTLRTRLVVSIALLAGLALVLADVAGLLQLRSSLLGQVDRQLTQGTTGFTRPSGAREPDLTAPRPRGLLNLGPDVRFSFYTADGRLDRVTGDTAGSGPDLGSFAQLTAHAGGRPYTVDDLDGGHPWRTIVARRPDSGALMVIAVSLRQLDATQNTLLGIDAAVAALVLLLLGLAAASAVRLGLAPLTAMQTTAEQIAAGDLSRRVDDADPHTEAGRLGIAFNAMLTQIEAALAARTASEHRLRQFLADASHELRTPLTSIQGFAELYRLGPFAPTGGDGVTAAGATEPPQGTQVALLEVLATGPGLPADQAERVFERLYRADASRQRTSGGAGLGLAIVAAIVVAHGGRVELRTGPGAGAAFRGLLPAEPGPVITLRDSPVSRWLGC